MKLCLLTFTRNNFEQAVNKIRRYYNFFDSFIIIDSSSEPPPDPGLGKVVIFRAPALGYADPLHQFGVRRTVELGCDWVVKLDVDEELSDDLLRDLRGILENSNCDVYGIPYYSMTPYSSELRLIIVQPRIFRPNKAYHSGIIHESEAQVQGKYCELDCARYFAIHIGSADYGKGLRYATIESYERPLTLRTFVLRSSVRRSGLLSLLSRFPLPMTVPPPIFFFLGIIYTDLRRYTRRLINRIIEPSLVKKLKMCKYGDLAPAVWDPYSKSIYDYMRSLDPREFVTRVHIAIDMHRLGDVTKYLCLDRDDVVERLTKIAEHIKNFGGIEFFEILMKLRYVTGGCDYVDKLEKILSVV